MKQLQLTEEIRTLITSAVGSDVDPTNFAVFEAIALNTNPLPGKDGTLFEDARVSALTLKQMADSINGGNHLPLVSNHDLSEEPKGRAFHAAVRLSAEGEPELRVLFYLDPTESRLIAKLNAGSLDEVSVNFLASQILCSECSFDYRGEEATFSNLLDRTCENGHEIGTDGVHVRLVGLAVFTELSLVSRGAADKPKIVGQSQSKLAAPLQQLAAKGFEVDRLFCQASKGVNNVELKELVTELTTAKVDLAARDATITTLTSERDTARTELEAATTRLTAAEARVAELEGVETEESPDLKAAREILADIFTKLAVAAGEENPTAPESIADLKAGIEKHQAAVTALIPVGGAAASTQNAETKTGAKFNASAKSAFQTR